MKTINVVVLAMMAILLGCNNDGSLADAKKVISRGEEYERGGEPEKANLEYIDLLSCEHILYIDLLDQNGNRVGSSEQVRYIDDNGQETDPYVKPSYLGDECEYDPDITRYGNCVIFPVVLPRPDALYTNMPIWTSAKVRLLPDGPVEELKVEYRFYNYRMIIWMNSCVNPSDPEMEEAWEKYWTAINYTITIQRVWLGGEQVWQRRTLCYPANPEGFSLYEDECNNDFVSDSNYVTPRFTKIVER